MKLNHHTSSNIIGWLHSLLLFLCFYPPAALILKLPSHSTVIFLLTGFFLLFPIIISWIMVKKARHLLFYLLIGILISCLYGRIMEALGILCGIAPPWASLFSTVLSLLIFLIRGYGRIKKGHLQKMLLEMSPSQPEQTDLQEMEVPTFLEVPHPLHWIFFALHYLAGALLKSDFYWRTAFFLLLADVFLCFACQFMESFYTFLKEHSRTANLPVNTMKKIVRILFGMACVILLLFALPSLLYGKEPLSTFTFDPPEYSIEDQELPIPMDSYEGGMDMEEFFSQEEIKEPPKWLIHLFNLLFYLISACIALAALALIYRACRNAGKYFSSETEDEIQFLPKNFSDQNLFSREKSLSSAGNLTVNRKIRKIYKKNIRKALKGAVQDSHTPTELEKSAGFPETEGYRNLHECYEKARYSKKGCTPEDAALLKNL